MAISTKSNLAKWYGRQASTTSPAFGGSNAPSSSSRVSFGASGLPSYITDAIKPSPSTSSTSIRDRVNEAMQADKKPTGIRDRVNEAMQADKKASQPIIREATGSQLDRSPDLSSVNTMEPGTARPSGPRPGSVLSDAVGKIVGSGPDTSNGSSSSSSSSSSSPSSSSSSSDESSAAPESEQITEEEASLNAEETELYNKILAEAQADYLENTSNEIRRLQNLETGLFGGGGTLEQTEFDQEQGRRRLAAQMASRGTLQGGAYAGGERGLGTLQQRSQDYDIQNLIRPFQQQTESDRLFELGIGFDPADEGYGGIFDILGEDDGFDWTTTRRGRSAAAEARRRAFEALMSGLVTL